MLEELTSNKRSATAVAVGQVDCNVMEWAELQVFYIAIHITNFFQLANTSANCGEISLTVVNI